MTEIRAFTFYAMVPLNLLLIVWVWIGRAFLGAGGWWIVVLTYTAVPVLILALGLSSILAITQRVPASAGRLTPPQWGTHLVVWASMLGFGFFLVDAGDDADARASVFTQVVGATSGTLAVSDTLTAICVLAFVAAWVVLLVLLVAGQGARRAGTIHSGAGTA
ncbi:hypothetical protein [Rhodococcus sp. NPDC058514]|uniref:hypothetical protein n=1 Tax=unclassified Rhodococcus (in: high G+C Gram-positive bacteria) TaxID=192944 RepID=UPI003648FBFE